MSTKMTVLAVSTEVTNTESLAVAVGQMLRAIDGGTSSENAEIVANAKEALQTWDNEGLVDKLFIIAGKLAGICYMKDSYFSELCQNIDKAKARAISTATMGHHSVADHPHVTVLFEGIPKLAAMVLNSLEMYTTSEKSARYTEMTPETELEMRLYKKWNTKMQEAIKDVYGETFIDDVSLNKLAQENARYMISVFTPTVMAYTASLRQFNYIIDWCENFAKIEQNHPEMQRLAVELVDVASLIKKKLYVKELRDTKGRGLTFVEDSMAWYDWGVAKDYFGDVYTVTYNASYAQVAQAQRHRTLHYSIGVTEMGAFIPEVIRDSNNGDSVEWMSDIALLVNSGVCPQGRLVRVVEQGLTTDFALKCKERLCGNAMKEITRQTATTLGMMLASPNNMGQKAYSSLKVFEADGVVVPRCADASFKCSKPCRWGKKYGITRKI